MQYQEADSIEKVYGQLPRAEKQEEVAENQRLGRAGLKCLTNSASETSGGLFFCVLGLLPSCQLLVVQTQKASWRNPNHKASNKVRADNQKPF